MLQCAECFVLPRRARMSFDGPQPLRVAMLARVVFPLHGFGGIERHVFHLVTHLARLGVCVTLYVQEPIRNQGSGVRDQEELTEIPTPDPRSLIPGVAE